MWNNVYQIIHKRRVFYSLSPGIVAITVRPLIIGAEPFTVNIVQMDELPTLSTWIEDDSEEIYLNDDYL